MAEMNETLTTKKGTTARSGSAVVIDGLKIGHEELFGAQQQIFLSDKTKKLRLTANTQKVTIIQHDSILLAVTQGENTIAYIERKEGQSTLKINKEYFDKLASQDEQIQALSGTPENGYYSLNISEARLGQDLSIRDLQVSGTDGQTFSVSFSALGCHLSGNGTHADKRNTNAQPFDIAVSTQFMQNALAEKEGCSYGEKTKKISDKVMQNLLISSIRLERELGDPQSTKPITNAFGLYEIISVPYNKQNKTNAINSVEFFRDITNNKVYIYHHSMGTANAQEFVPVLSEIRDCQIQRNDKGTLQLSFGLGNGNGQRLVIPFSRDPHFVENLDFLQRTLLSKQFERTNSFDGSDPKILLLSGIDKKYTFNAFAAPKEGSFQPFDENVAQLQKTFTEFSLDKDVNAGDTDSFTTNSGSVSPAEPMAEESAKDYNSTEGSLFTINSVSDAPAEPITITAETANFTTFNNDTDSNDDGSTSAPAATPVQEEKKEENATNSDNKDAVANKEEKEESKPENQEQKDSNSKQKEKSTLKKEKTPLRKVLHWFRTVLTQQPWNGGLIAVTLAASVFIFPFFYITSIVLATAFALEKFEILPAISKFLDSHGYGYIKEYPEKISKKEKLQNRINDCQKNIEEHKSNQIKAFTLQYNQQLKAALAQDRKTMLSQLKSNDKKTRGLINTEEINLKKIDNNLKNRTNLEAQVAHLNSLMKLKDTKEYQDSLAQLQKKYPELKNVAPEKLLNSATEKLNKLPQEDAMLSERKAITQKLQTLNLIYSAFEGMSPDKFETIKLIDLSKLQDGQLPNELIEKLNNFNKLVKFMGDSSDVEINPDDLESIKKLKETKRKRDVAQQEHALIVKQNFESIRDEESKKLIEKKKNAEEKLTKYLKDQEEAAKKKKEAEDKKKKKNENKKKNKKIKKGEELLENDGLENFEIKSEKTPEQIAAEEKKKMEEEEEKKKKAAKKPKRTFFGKGKG